MKKWIEENSKQIDAVPENTYELHSHTSQSSLCAAANAKQMVSTYAKAGYTGIIITDHFLNGNSAAPPNKNFDKRMPYFLKGYENAKRHEKKYNIQVFFGVEYTYKKGKEVLVYGIEPDFFLNQKNLEHMPFSQFCSKVKSAGGCIVQAHPFREASYIDNNCVLDPKLLDGVEVYNHCNRKPVWNEQAWEYAKKHNLVMISGSDDHYAMHAGRCGIILPYKVKNSKQLVENILSGKCDMLINGKVVKQMNYNKYCNSEL